MSKKTPFWVGLAEKNIKNLNEVLCKRKSPSILRAKQQKQQQLRFVIERQINRFDLKKNTPTNLLTDH